MFNIKKNKNKKPVGLVILDGVGQVEASEGNAVKLANTPNLDKWTKEYPNILMNASGEFVGLPKGQMGNSEVGHMNIGAGRIVYQSLALINKEIDTKEIYENKTLNNAIDFAKEKGSKVHVLGLVSDGGVHSHINHIIEVIKMFQDKGIETYLHAFTDGRDVAPKSVLEFADPIIKNNIRLASISGRYYAMDRDKRWERVQLAYDAIVNAKGNSFTKAKNYIEEQYKLGHTDEFVIPAFNKNFSVKVEENDVVIIVNFRPDRAREIAHMIRESKTEITKYDYQSPEGRVKNVKLLTMREFAGIDAEVIYPNTELKNVLGEVLEDNKVVQMRAAETEKYPHVTFFLDGGKEIPKKHEKRILVDSPKVATYDLAPEMSARPLTDKIIENLDNVEALIINYAQPDMVGHTGVIPAVIKSVEVADEMLGKLYEEIVVKREGILIITADHGNADEMLNEKGEIVTKHSTNPVQVLLTSHDFEFKNKFKNGVVAKLGDLAPTLLTLLNIKIPKEMEGEVLINEKK